jgi:hypothetical protein
VLKTLLRLALLAGIGAAVYAALPDIKRYLEMNRM